jgi:hypothetical protein
MRRLILLATALLVVCAITAHAAPPATVSYQGILTDQNGVVVPDANYSVRFRLYQGATVVWEETQNVAVAGGRFGIELGAVVPLSGLPFDPPYSLGIKVGSDAELAPLTPLTCVPYSMTARSVVMDPTIRFYSVSAEEFTPGSDTIPFSRNTLSLSTTNTGSCSFGAGLHLPHGARLVEWQVLFEDIDPSLEVAVALRRTNVTTGSFQQVSLVTSGVANASGLTLATTTSFSDDIVDNENWAYSLQVFFSTGAGADLTVRTARVAYEITEPLP